MRSKQAVIPANWRSSQTCSKTLLKAIARQQETLAIHFCFIIISLFSRAFSIFRPVHKGISTADEHLWWMNVETFAGVLGMLREYVGRSLLPHPTFLPLNIFTTGLIG